MSEIQDMTSVCNTTEAIQRAIRHLTRATLYFLDNDNEGAVDSIDYAISDAKSVMESLREQSA